MLTVIPGDSLLHLRRKTGRDGQVGRRGPSVDPADPLAWNGVPDPPSSAQGNETPRPIGTVLLWIGAIVITGFVLLSETRRWGMLG